MIKILKKRIKLVIDRFKMRKEFHSDYKHYKKWNYHNPRVQSLAAYESKILRQTHIVEKGLSISHPRKGFGKKKRDILIEQLKEYCSLGFSPKRIPFENAVFALDKYVEEQAKVGYSDPELDEALTELHKLVGPRFAAGIDHSDRKTMEIERHSEFPTFFRSRHSIRQFGKGKVSMEALRKAVQLAQKAPTACNRQAAHVYYYADKETNVELGKLIAGNTGFSDDVENYLVVTADVSAFYDTFERNQIYIEAGFFAMALIESLHYYGIASCTLQNGEFAKKNQQFKSICKNIPESERIMLFIAIGPYKEEFDYAISERKPVEDILRIRS